MWWIWIFQHGFLNLDLDSKEPSLPQAIQWVTLLKKSKKQILLEVKNQSHGRLQLGLEWEDWDVLMSFFLTLSDVFFVLYLVKYFEAKF